MRTYNKNSFRIGCGTYKIIETKEDYIYSLIDEDLNEIIITDNLYECIKKATKMLEKVLWNE